MKRKMSIRDFKVNNNIYISKSKVAHNCPICAKHFDKDNYGFKVNCKYSSYGTYNWIHFECLKELKEGSFPIRDFEIVRNINDSCCHYCDKKFDNIYLSQIGLMTLFHQSCMNSLREHCIKVLKAAGPFIVANKL